MPIQWYPGHMHKANKILKKTLPRVDLIIEILDARIPFSSENPLLAKLRADKPCIKILHKEDLADIDKTQQWQHYLEQQKAVKTLALSRNSPEKIRQLLPDLCKKIAKDSIHTDKALQAIIIGIPNVGKSTIINILAGKRIAKTGNEPAVTKMQQRIDLKNGLMLLDTPGVLWPNIENQNSAYRLASTGAIKETALENTDVAFFVADYLLQAYPERLLQRYQLKKLPENELEFLESIARKRGCLVSGGQINLEKISKILLTELRAGQLGRISFETPEMVATEIIETQRRLHEKAANKTARRLARKKKKQRR